MFFDIMDGLKANYAQHSAEADTFRIHFLVGAVDG